MSSATISIFLIKNNIIYFLYNFFKCVYVCVHTYIKYFVISISRVNFRKFIDLKFI